ncbi:MAG: DUF6580 family putative transport protein [Verrucomicrobiia bacterium]
MPFSFLLILFVALYRILMPLLNGWPNFAPLMALSFCAAIYWPGFLAMMIPIGALFISDLWLNHYYHASLLAWSMLPAYFCYAMAWGLGRWVKYHKFFTTIFTGSLLGSSLFYLITNSISWFAEPLYAKTAGGWWQAITIGLPSYPPTYLFFKNSLISDLLFTGLFVLTMELSSKKVSPAIVAR